MKPEARPDDGADHTLEQRDGGTHYFLDSRAKDLATGTDQSYFITR